MKKSKSEKAMLRDRWRTEEFKKSIGPALKSMVARKKNAEPLDLRGGSFGFYIAPFPLAKKLHFVNFNLRDIQFDYSTFDGPLADSVFENVDFSSCDFKRCVMAKSKFIRCRFRQATLAMPDLDDSILEDCDFTGALMKGTFTNGGGGRRVVFKRCCFRDMQFKGVEFRASKFIDCDFEGAKFLACTLAFVKFEGTEPAKSQLIDVDFLSEAKAIFPILKDVDIDQP